jgi:hypothetical protein
MKIANSWRIGFGAVLVIGIIAIISVTPCWPFRPGINSVHGVFLDCPELRGTEFIGALEKVLAEENVRYMRWGNMVYVTYDVWEDRDLVSEYSFKAIAEARRESQGYHVPVQIMYLCRDVFTDGREPTNIFENIGPNARSIAPEKRLTH